MAVYDIDDLTYTQVGSNQLMIGAFDDIRHQGDFSTNTAGDYSPVTLSGSTTVTIGSGSAQFTHASSGGAVLKPDVQLLAPYAYATITVSAVSNPATVTPICGFHKDSNNYCWAYVQNGRVGIDSKIGGNAASVLFDGTITAPYTLYLALCYPEAVAWADYPGYPAWIGNLTLATTDLRALTRFQSGWKPVYGFDRSAGGTTGTASAWSSGYLGCAPGIRDYKPITYADGRPYVVGTKQYFSATCATGGDFATNHMGVITVDVNTGDADLVSHLFYNIASSDLSNSGATKDICTALYGGQIVRTVADDGWLILTNGWGYQTIVGGIDLFYATTTANILTGIHTLDAYSLSGLSSTSLYDCTIRHDGSQWRMSCAETATRTSWSSYHAAYYTGAALTSLSQIRTDNSHEAEQQIWAKVNGTWYLTSGGTSGPHYWNDDLSSYLGTLLAGLTLTGTNVSYSSFGSGYCLTGIVRGARTQYMVLLFSDDTSGFAGATKGAFVCEQSDQFSDVVEWPYGAAATRITWLRA